jgi:hypothetical protein
MELVCIETKNMAFPLKLHYIIENEPYIEWRSEGTMFEIMSMEDFVARVMPRHFRTASMSSFVRNLNYYGFRKIKSGPGAGRHHHPDFQRSKLDQIKGMKRILKKPKRPNATSSGDGASVSNAVAPRKPEDKMSPHQEAALILQNLGMFSPRTNAHLRTQAITAPTLTIPTPTIPIPTIPIPTTIIPAASSTHNVLGKLGTGSNGDLGNRKLAIHLGGTPPSETSPLQATSPPSDQLKPATTKTPAISRTRPSTPPDAVTVTKNTVTVTKNTDSVVLDGCSFVPFHSGPGSSKIELSPILVERLNKLDDYSDVKLNSFISENVASFKILDDAGQSFFISLLSRKIGNMDNDRRYRLKNRISKEIARSITAS